MEALNYFYEENVEECSVSVDDWNSHGAWMMMMMPFAAIGCCAAVVMCVRKWRQQPGGSNHTVKSSDEGQQLLLSLPPAHVIAHIARSEWDQIAVWIDTLPTTTTASTPSSSSERRQRYPTVLHCAILYRAPPELVQRILRVVGGDCAALVQDTRGETPLLWVVRFGTWEYFGAMLLEAAPEAIVLPNDDGTTPIDLLLKRFWTLTQPPKDQRTCMDRILQMLECYARYEWQKQQQQHAATGQRFFFSPLHAATQLTNGCTDSLLSTIVLQNSTALLQRDAWGRTPLHWAAARRNSTGVQKLLKAAPSGVTMEEASTGRLPFHLAVIAESEPSPTGDDPDARWQWRECLLPLLQHTPLSLQHSDPVTGLPLCAVASTVETAFRLLRHNPTVLQHCASIQ